MLPEEMKLFVDTRQHGPEHAKRAFLPGQEGIRAAQTDYKSILLPVRLLEQGIPGCYLHCAASAPQAGLIPLGIIGGAARSSVGLIRVPGYYKRNAWYRHISHQSCRPHATGKIETVSQSADLASICNQAFPACGNSCVAANHEYTLYYVNAESGTVMPQIAK